MKRACRAARLTGLVLLLIVCCLCALADDEADFTRVFSSETVSPGGKVAIVYTVTNTGEEPLMHVRVLDGSGAYAAEKGVVSPGASVSFRNLVTVYDTYVSSPTLTYTVDGKEKTVYLDKVSVKAIRISFSASLAREGENFILTVTNSGEGDIASVTAEDALGGLAGVTYGLAPGETREVACRLSAREDGIYTVRVTATDAGGDTKETEVCCIVEKTDAGGSCLSLSASPEHDKINCPGRIYARVTVSNSGGRAENVTLLEKATGYTRVLRVVPENGSVTCRVPLDVSEDTEYLFTLSGSDCASGFTVRIAGDGDKPDETADESVLEKLSRYTGVRSVYIRMVLWGCAVLVALLILIRFHSSLTMRAAVRRQEETRYRALLRRRLRRRKDRK